MGGADGMRGGFFAPALGRVRTRAASCADAARAEAWGLLKDRDVDRAVFRPVELAEKHSLVPTERRGAALERDQHLRAGNGGAAVRGPVGPVGVVVNPS